MNQLQQLQESIRLAAAIGGEVILTHECLNPNRKQTMNPAPPITPAAARAKRLEKIIKSLNQTYVARKSRGVPVTNQLRRCLPLSTAYCQAMEACRKEGA